MKEGIDFYYDGIRSRDMGLFNVKLATDMYNEPFISDREIQEIVIRGNDKPYFQGVKRSPLVFKLEFAFDGSYDEKRIREVARWLNQDYYKPFYTTDNTERIFYCLPQSSSELIHNGLKRGYITLEMRCDSPFSYSPQYMSRTYDWDEAPIILSETNVDGDFEAGSHINVFVGEGGKLQIDSVKSKWNELSAAMVWNDL
jgi:phage-related protein